MCSSLVHIEVWKVQMKHARSLHRSHICRARCVWKYEWAMQRICMSPFTNVTESYHPFEKIRGAVLELSKVSTLSYIMGKGLFCPQTYTFFTSMTVALHIYLSLWHANTDLQKVIRSPTLSICVSCSVLQCVAVCCSVLQCLAVRPTSFMMPMDVCTYLNIQTHLFNKYTEWPRPGEWRMIAGPLQQKRHIIIGKCAGGKTCKIRSFYVSSNQITSPHQRCYTSLSHVSFQICKSILYIFSNSTPFIPWISPNTGGGGLAK